MKTSTAGYDSCIVDGINLAALDAFRGAVTPATFRRLTSSFAAEAEARVQRIQSALSHNDRGVLENEAHALKSAAALFGAIRLSRIAAYLERFAPEEEEDVRALVEALAMSAAEVCAALRADIGAEYPPASSTSLSS